MKINRDMIIGLLVGAFLLFAVLGLVELIWPYEDVVVVCEQIASSWSAGPVR